MSNPKPTAPAVPPVAAPAVVMPVDTSGQLPAVVPPPPPDFSDAAGSGFEGAGREDMAIPFLSVLQGLSPEVKRSEGAYIEGAFEGMVFNTVTKEAIDTSVNRLVVIPCAYHRAFVEWRVREAGGGFVAEHPSTTPLQTQTTRDDRGRDILPNGNQLNDTRTFYVMVVDETQVTVSPAVITMTSTQIKKAKQWLMQQNLLKLRGPGGAYTPPMFASRWVVATVPESNQKGTWYGWKFEHDGYLAGPADPMYLAAREFYQSVAAGKVRADLTKTAPAPAKVNPDTGEPMPGEDDIPF